MNDFEGFSEFTAGSVLKRAWRIMWKNRGEFIGLTLLSFVIATAVTVLYLQFNYMIYIRRGIGFFSKGRDYTDLILALIYVPSLLTPLLVFVLSAATQRAITNSVFQLFISERTPEPSERPQPNCLLIFLASLTAGAMFVIAFLCLAMDIMYAVEDVKSGVAYLLMTPAAAVALVITGLAIIMSEWTSMPEPPEHLRPNFFRHVSAFISFAILMSGGMFSFAFYCVGADIFFAVKLGEPYLLMALSVAINLVIAVFVTMMGERTSMLEPSEHPWPNFLRSASAFILTVSIISGVAFGLAFLCVELVTFLVVYAVMLDGTYLLITALVGAIFLVIVVLVIIIMRELMIFVPVCAAENLSINAAIDKKTRAIVLPSWARKLVNIAPAWARKFINHEIIITIKTHLSMKEQLARGSALTRGYRAKTAGICVLSCAVMTIVTIIIVIAAMMMIIGLNFNTLNLEPDGVLTAGYMPKYLPAAMLAAAVMILPLTYINVLPAVVYCSLRAVRENQTPENAANI